MKLIDHEWDFGSGVRVLVLKGRRKDDADVKRVVTRVSYSPQQFLNVVYELSQIARDNERIYCTAGERSLEKASRRFREMQLAWEYDKEPMKFYHNLEARWASALMQPISQKSKVWMFDIDSPAERALVDQELIRVGHSPLYIYKTKNGWHYLMAPFNKSELTDEARSLLSDNALALLGY
ncbi:MAG: hypothetical protein AAGK93_07900 [Pseudomonadota bacterium]